MSCGTRAAPYRLTEQTEGARVAELQGLIGGLEAALGNPGLPDAVREELTANLMDAERSLAQIPTYDTRFSGTVLQVGSIFPVASPSGRPLYAHVKATGFRRRDPAGVLPVGAQRIELASLYSPSDSWIIGLGITSGHTRAEVASFDGLNTGVSVGRR